MRGGVGSKLFSFTRASQGPIKRISFEIMHLYAYTVIITYVVRFANGNS